MENPRLKKPRAKEKKNPLCQKLGAKWERIEQLLHRHKKRKHKSSTPLHIYMGEKKIK